MDKNKFCLICGKRFLERNKQGYCRSHSEKDVEWLREKMQMAIAKDRMNFIRNMTLSDRIQIELWCDHALMQIKEVR